MPSSHSSAAGASRLCVFLRIEDICPASELNICPDSFPFSPGLYGISVVLGRLSVNRASFIYNVKQKSKGRRLVGVRGTVLPNFLQWGPASVPPRSNGLTAGDAGHRIEEGLVPGKFPGGWA